MKMSVSKEKITCDTGFSNFAIEFLRENENVRVTDFVCSNGSRSNILNQTNDQKSRDTVPLMMHLFEKAEENETFLFRVVTCMYYVMTICYWNILQYTVS